MVNFQEMHATALADCACLRDGAIEKSKLSLISVFLFLFEASLVKVRGQAVGEGFYSGRSPILPSFIYPVFVRWGAKFIIVICNLS
jgi:hypothetical protein